MRVRGVAALSIVLAAAPVYAQSLAEVVPPDAVGYVGWRGTQDPGPGYAGSKLEAVLKDSQIGRFVDETLPAAGAAADRKYPWMGGQGTNAAAVLHHVIRRPSALYVSLIDGKPRGGLLCRAGSDGKALAQAINSLVAAMPPLVQAKSVVVGDAVGLTLGYPGDGPASVVDQGAGLATVPAFMAGVGHGVKDPVAVAYIDVKAVRGLIDKAVADNLEPVHAERYTKFMAASGFDGVESITVVDGFSGREWQSDTFVAAPAPRKGFFDVSDAAAADGDLLKHVPASANLVAVQRLDPAGAVKTLREVAYATDPQAGDLFDKALGGATLAIGKNFESDLVASLGPRWAAYTSPDVGGASGAGMVVINKLANPAKAKTALAAASIFLSNTSQNLLREQNITLAGQMTRVGDVSVFYIAAPLISPAWAIKDGYLYAGLYPQTVIAAAKFDGPGVGGNAAYAGAAKLGDGVPISLSYVDTNATLDDGYASAMAISRTIFGLSDMFLAATPEPVLPSLSVLRQQGGPAVRMAWASDAGFHSRSRSPYPGADALATMAGSGPMLNLVPQMIGTFAPMMAGVRHEVQFETTEMPAGPAGGIAH